MGRMPLDTTLSENVAQLGPVAETETHATWCVAQSAVAFLFHVVVDILPLGSALYRVELQMAIIFFFGNIRYQRVAYRYSPPTFECCMPVLQPDEARPSGHRPCTTQAVPAHNGE